LYIELLPSSPVGGSSGLRRISSQARMKILANVGNSLATVTGAESHMAAVDSMRRVASSGCLSSMAKSSMFEICVLLKLMKFVYCVESYSVSSLFGFVVNQFTPFAAGASVGGINGKVWAAMIAFERDPYPGVQILAKTVMEYVRMKAREAMTCSGSGVEIMIMIDSLSQIGILTSY